MILAAGSSSRLGQPKQLLKTGDQLLLQKIVSQAYATGYNTSVVLGSEYEAVYESIKHFPVDINWNRDWFFGMGGSLSFGLKKLIENHENVDSMMLLLCDQIHVTPDLLQELIKIHKDEEPVITASKYGNSHGAPAIFSKETFNELLLLAGHVGAKSIIDKYIKKTSFIDFPKGNIDIDTPDDLHLLE